MNASEFAWRIANDDWTIKYCKTCGNKTEYNSSRRSFAAYCCKSCGYADPSRNTKIAETMLEKYGVTNAAHSDTLVAKKIETCLTNYGFSHPSKSETVKKKKRETMQERWGVDNASQCPEIQQKN